MVKLNSSNLMFVFLKLTIIFGLTRQVNSFVIRPLLGLLSSQFTKPTWFFYKKIIMRKFGLYSNNLIKSYIHYTVYNLERGLSNKYTSNNMLGYGSYIPAYSKPIALFNFPFHKKVYNTFIFYIIYILLDTHTAITNHFNLYYSFVLLKSNMYFLSALNNYYLKIHHH